jgi:hypothetical protein
MVYNPSPGLNSEFSGGYHGDCGETALAEAMAAAAGTYEATTADINQVVQRMQKSGQADGQGVTNLNSLADYAKGVGFTVSTFWGYAEPFPHDWHQALLDNAGLKPIVLQLANAQALYDDETGSADEKGVQYHFITILAKQTDGYKVADGDNPEAKTRYPIYSYQTLINAKPCGLMIIEPLASKPAPAPAPAPDPKDEETANLKAQLNAANAQIAELKQQVAAKPGIPADLHSTLSNLVNATAAFAELNTAAQNVMKELGY